MFGTWTVGQGIIASGCSFGSGASTGVGEGDPTYGSYRVVASLVQPVVDKGKTVDTLESFNVSFASNVLQ
jgi:hypothetical protein